MTWISVQDRLPEESGYYVVLVWYDGWNSSDVYFDSKARQWTWDDENHIRHRIDAGSRNDIFSYWISLPVFSLPSAPEAE